MSGVIRIKGHYPDIQVHDHGGFQSRHTSTLSLIRDVFLKDSSLFSGRFYNFAICTVDNPESANVLAEKLPYVLTYSTTPSCLPNIIAIPDFVYGGWPEAGIASYDACTQSMIVAGQEPSSIDKVFWIGNTKTDPSRSALINIGNNHTDDMHFVAMEWRDDKIVPNGRLQSSYYVSMPDHCQYSMLLDIRGAGYSGRLKLLLHAHRPVFLVERRFREFFYDKLIPYEHFMPIREDLSNLAAQVHKVKTSPQLADSLRNGATTFANAYLSKDYAANYLKEVLLKIGVSTP